LNLASRMKLTGINQLWVADTLGYRSPEEFEGQQGVPTVIETATSATLVFFRS